MTIRYYRGPYPDEKVPPDVPLWFFYEVDVEQDNVLRMVESFPDGSSTRNSLDIEAQHGPRWESLIDQPFMADIEAMALVCISAQEFEAAWENGKDTPFWNASSNRFPPSS